MSITLTDPDLLRQQAYIDGAWVDADSGETFPVFDNMSDLQRIA